MFGQAKLSVGRIKPSLLQATSLTKQRCSVTQLSFDDHGNHVIEELKIYPVPKSIALIAERKGPCYAVVFTAPRVAGSIHVP